MLINRPLVVFGAAFLITVMAALFVPLLLLFIALPCAFGLLFLKGSPRTVALILSLGCLTAIITSGLFFVRLGSSRTLVGTVQQVNGSIFYENGRQMASVTTADGQKMITALFPITDDLETGDGIVGTIMVNEVNADDSSGLLSGGLLFSCTPVELTYSPTQKTPLQIRGMLLRERLCKELRTALPTAATNTTVAILFSIKEYMSPQLRSAFSSSGMSHLLAVSGLHLSILVWTLVAAIKRLGGGRWLQAAVGSCAALLIFFAVGMSPSVFRATLMTLLTLLGGLVSRKSDGLTSLSVTAAILVACSPPIIANLSFLLSFMSVAGILLLTPRLFDAMERLWVSHFSRCSKAARWMLLAVSVSAAAQLATAPVVAFHFGSLPLLGIVVNLVAIPLVYPVLVFGFAACLGLAVLPNAAPLLLLPANLCSSLLGSIADITSHLPFCALNVVFPSDLLPIILLAVVAASAVVLTHRVQLLRKITLLCTICALLSVGINAVISYNSITAVSSSVTGSLIITSRDGTLIIDHTQGGYHRRLDSDLMERIGAEPPIILATTYPYDTKERIASVAEHYETDKLYLPEQLSVPIELLPDIWVSVPQLYVTEITIHNTKLMKFFATCDTIDKLDRYGGDVLLADRQGNLLSLGASRHLLRRKNGESFTRIYRNGGA